MPQRIPKPCRVRSCPNKTIDRDGYCDTHRPAFNSWRQWQQKQGNVTQRGYGSQWQRLRIQILKRDDHLCQLCLGSGKMTRASHVDHIIPKAQGGDDAFINLQSLCPTCHQRKTGAERGTLQPLGGAG